MALYGCSSNSADQFNKAEDTARLPAIEVTKKSKIQLANPDETVRKFLSWYVTNHDRLPGDFVENVLSQDSTKFYSVNIAGTEKWLTAVQRSGYFSKVYLQDWRNYFQQYADTLRLLKQNDGPPRGFEYDFLLLSQEPDTRVAELQQGTFTAKFPKPNRALVEMRGPQRDGWREGLKFTLSKDNTGQWLIDSIANPTDLTP